MPTAAQTTKKELDRLFKNLNLAHGGSMPYQLDKQAQGYRLGRPSPMGGYRDISPRLPAREMLQWLEGYLAAMNGE